MLSIPEVSYIGYYKAPYGSNPQPRTIPDGQQDIEIMIAGRGFFEYDNQMIEADAGTILWHGQGERTLYINDFENPYECYVISLKSAEKPDIQTVSHWSDRISFRIFLDHIMTEYHSEQKDMEKLSYYIFGQLYWNCRTVEHKLPHFNKRYEEIQRVKDYIDLHFAEDITMSRLSKLADLSIPHLHAVFKELVQQTPYQFLQAKRILEARKLLATTRLSIKEVCAKSGFRDMGNFCRLFKKAHGLTAQEYRMQYADKR